MSVNVTYTSTLKTVETLEGTPSAHQALDKAVTSQLSTSLVSQGVSSTPPCKARAGTDLALTAGSGSIDLTALLGTGGGAVNGSSVGGAALRVQYIKFLNPGTNANPITVAKGASNGYDGFGADFKITLAPGAEAMFALNDAGADIGASNKILDVTGTGSQVLSYEIVMG